MSNKKYTKLFSLTDLSEIQQFSEEHNLDVNHKNKKGEHLLFIHDNMDIIKWLVETKKVDIDVTNKYGKNALFHAGIPKTRYLIEQGINVNHTDNAGKNALFHPHFEKAQLLVAAGINVNHTSLKERNAAFYTTDPKILDLYSQHGLNFDQVDYIGRGIFNSIGLYSLRNNDNKLAYLENLIKKGLNPKTQAKNLLFHCIKENFIEGVSYLVSQHNINVNMDNYGKNVLFHARDFNQIELLIKYGADINSVDENGNSLLFNENLNVIKFFIAKGVNINHLNHSGLNFLDYFIKENTTFYSNPEKEIATIINYCFSDKTKQSMDINYFKNTIESFPFVAEKILKLLSKRESGILRKNININHNENNLPMKRI